MPCGVRMACDCIADRSSGNLLQLATHARKVRRLRHCGDFSNSEFPMKPAFHIANPTALRPYGHGPATCGLLRRECDKGFIPHD